MTNLNITPIQLEIGRQLAHTKPAHLRPGIDIVFVPIIIEGHESLAVGVVPDGTKAVVRYNEGADDYTVTRKRYGGEVERFDRVYCDQLGELIYGTDAEPYTEPIVQIFEIGEDGEPRKVWEG